MIPLATFKGYSGINAFWPLGGMQVDAPDGIPRVRPAPNTYLFADAPHDFDDLEAVTESGRKWHFTVENLAIVVNAGFDHVRLQYEPTPIMHAIRDNDSVLLNFVFKQFDICIDALMGAGLKVVLSGILAGYANLQTAEHTFAGLNSDGYLLYKQHLIALCQRYANRDPRFFTIEIFNEPPGNGSTVVRPPGYPNWGHLYTGNWETDYQPDLYAAFRAHMPRHTAMLTCDGWSNWEVLASYDPTPYLHDFNVVWQYHPLEPTPVSLAGYIYNQYRYIERLAYPPGSNRLDPSMGTYEGSVARMEALVDKYPNHPAAGGNPEATKAGLRGDLWAYYNIPEGKDWVRDKIDTLSDWARHYGINPSNLYAGEYGATRDNTGFPGNILGLAGGSLGVTRLDRIHLYRDFTEVLVRNGHRRAPDHLDTLNYGVTKAQNKFIGPFDEQLLRAMRPRRILLLEE